MLVLVTGATGFIARQLIPRLLERGHRVRALARDPARLQGQRWAPSVQLVAGDVLQPESLPPALQGVDTAYYLIHSLASGRGYAQRDLEGARNFARAAAHAGVRHIVYLGGLVGEGGESAGHLRSRIETGALLRQGPVPVTEFRASVIAGAGGVSYEMIRSIVEHLPLIPGPTSLVHRVQPIAAQNVVDYLLAALDAGPGGDRVFEIGGPQVMSYAELMLEYARARGLKRRVLMLPGLPVWLMALSFALLAPVSSPAAAALVGSLGSDSVAASAEARVAFPQVKLIDWASVVRSTSGTRQRRPLAGALEEVAAGWRTAMTWVPRGLALQG